MNRNLIALALCNVASVVAIIGAVLVIMTVHDRGGAGLLMLCACLLHSSPKSEAAEAEEGAPPPTARGGVRS